VSEGRINLFAYVFRLKSNVLRPNDLKGLNESHYICCHREPLAELIDLSPRAVIQHFIQVGLSPSWYKRGLQPLASSDVIWYDGTGYMIVPGPPFIGHTKQYDGTHTIEIELDPRKILSCKE
jgi:hypothetical protein